MKELIVWLGGETAGNHRQARYIKSLFLLRHVKVIWSPSRIGMAGSTLVSTCTPVRRKWWIRNLIANHYQIFRRLPWIFILNLVEMLFLIDLDHVASHWCWPFISHESTILIRNPSRGLKLQSLLGSLNSSEEAIIYRIFQCGLKHKINIKACVSNKSLWCRRRISWGWPERMDESAHSQPEHWIPNNGQWPASLDWDPRAAWPVEESDVQDLFS